MIKRLILLIYFCLLTSLSIAQENPLSIFLGNIRTDAEKSAIRLAINYTQDINGIFITDAVDSDGNWLLSIDPEVKIETGEEDAFSSLIVKASGMFISFSDTTIAGIGNVPKSNSFLNIIPVSIGFETDKTFDNVNGLVEVGYIPWYQLSNRTPDIIRKTKIGIFLQGGFKFKLTDVDSVNNIGGNVSEGEEIPDDPLLRIKGSLGFDTKYQFKENGFGIGLIGMSDAWYDFLNSKIYYRLQAVVRVLLSNDKFIDFDYEKGSGAPNFNEGDQYGVGLTIDF